MNESVDKWGLTILAAHSQRWSQQVAKEFRESVTSMIADVELRMRAEHPSLHLRPHFVAAGSLDVLKANLGESIAFAIIDVTDFDENLAFLAGQVRGARVPYVLVCQSESEQLARRALNPSEMIQYQSITDAFHNDSPLCQNFSQAITHARVLEELVYELWFPRGTSAISVVCPQDHDPGEFANRSNPDYTYLDNLGDTDALLEILVFLSRHYPKASVQKFSSDDLPRDHTKNNLVVIGGPGSSDDISNRVCQEMMSSMNSCISYTADCDVMRVTLDGVEPLKLRAEFSSNTPDHARPDRFNMRRDRGYFARFPNPLNEASTVVLVNGIHTAGVLGAARAFADRSEALRNYHFVFNSSASPKSFECYFDVIVLNGDAKVPIVSPETINPLGPKPPAIANPRGDVEQSKPTSNRREPVTVQFIAGDRGGAQRNQIQIHNEFDSIKTAIEGSKHREGFKFANPIHGATPLKLTAAYRDRPAVLHFAGHGDDRSLSLIFDQGLLVSETQVMAAQLVRILGSFPDRILLCVLNTCASSAIAKHLVDIHVVDAAIGWSARLADPVAISFSGALYRGLGDGLTLEQSVTLAAESCTQEVFPDLYTDDGIDPHTTTLVGGTEE